MKQEKKRIENDCRQCNALLENCTEMSEFIQDLQDALVQSHKELQYLQTFIISKNLETEYHYFLKHACEVFKEDLPFPIISL